VAVCNGNSALASAGALVTGLSDGVAWRIGAAGGAFVAMMTFGGGIGVAVAWGGVGLARCSIVVGWLAFVLDARGIDATVDMARVGWSTMSTAAVGPIDASAVVLGGRIFRIA